MSSSYITPVQAAEMLLAQDEILILCHKNPDGDSWGSALALFGMLKCVGKPAAVSGIGDIPAQYSYLRALSDNASQSLGHPFVVSVDCSTKERLIGGYSEEVDLSIDHHPSNTGYARFTLLDSDAASCCEIVLELCEPLGAVPNSHIANALYTGVVTDTGGFRHSGTTANTHRAAAKLIEWGADTARLNGIFFGSKTMARLNLEREALNRLSFYLGGRVAVVTVPLSVSKECGAADSDFDGLSDIAKSAEGVEFGILLRELEGAVKVSIRSREKDANALAAVFGGGGHIRAAGFETDKVTLKQLTDSLLAECEKQL